MNGSTTGSTTPGWFAATGTCTYRWNYCANCGRKLESAWNYCAGCGTPIGQSFYFQPYYLQPYYLQPNPRDGQDGQASAGANSER